MARFQYNMAGMFLWLPSTKIVQAVMIRQYTFTDCPVNVNRGYTSLWSMCYLPSV